MKLAMAQMRMTGSMDENLKTSLEMCNRVGLEIGRASCRERV